MSKAGIYLFRNVQTSQVLVHWSRVLEPKHLEQIKNVTQRPAHLRKDLWKPMVVACGLEDNVARNLCNRVVTTPPSMPEDLAAYKLQKRKVRAKQELDQTGDKIAALCYALYRWEINAKERGQPVPPVQLYWEYMPLNASVAVQKLKWPEYVSHHQLDLVRGRIITTEAIVSRPPSASAPDTAAV